MTGSSIFDYIHPQDHAEVAEQLGLGLASNQGLASPSSAISDENGTNQGTNNPDGKCFFQFYVEWKGILLREAKYPCFLMTSQQKLDEKSNLWPEKAQKMKKSIKEIEISS